MVWSLNANYKKKSKSYLNFIQKMYSFKIPRYLEIILFLHIFRIENFRKLFAKSIFLLTTH